MRKYLSLIAIIIIASMIMLTFSSCVEYEEENTQPSEEASESESIEVLDESNASTNKSTFPNVTLPGYSELEIYADTTRADVDFYNPKENSNYYYLAFELRLLNTSTEGYEVLYKSEAIEPEKQIRQINLTRSLTVGEYDALIYIQPYKMDGKMTPVNGINVKIKLVVKPNLGLSDGKWPNVACPGWGEIILPPDTKEINADFYNPVENEGYYYLTYEIRLLNDSAQGYEVLYNSGIIEPGEHVYKITLSKGLPLGEYQAVMHVQPYKMDGLMTPTNNMNSNLKLTVINLAD